MRVQSSNLMSESPPTPAPAAPNSAALNDMITRIIAVASRPPLVVDTAGAKFSERCSLTKRPRPEQLFGGGGCAGGGGAAAVESAPVVVDKARRKHPETASLQNCSGPPPKQTSRLKDIPAFFAPAQVLRSGKQRAPRAKAVKKVQKVPAHSQEVIRGDGWSSSAQAGVIVEVNSVPSSKARTRAMRQRKEIKVALNKSKQSKRYLNRSKRAEVCSQNPGIFCERFDGVKTALLCNICKFVVRDGAAATPARIARHLQGKIHLAALARHTKQSAIQGDVCKMLKIATTSSDGAHAMFQAATVKMCVSLAIPLDKVNGMRDYLEFYTSHKLQDSSNLRKLYIPMIRDAHFAEVAEMVERGTLLSLVHDGTSRFATYYCIVVRWVTEDLEIQQRCLSLRSYTGHLKGGQLAMAIDQSLQSVGARKGAFRDDGGLDMGSLLCINRDRASVNQAAANAIAPLYLGYFDLECCPHSLVKPGEYVAFPALTEFKDRLMIALNSSAFSAHVLSYVTKPIRKPSATRWWSTFELYAQLLSLMPPTVPPGPPLMLFDKLVEALQNANAADGVMEDSLRVRRLKDWASNPLEVHEVLLQMRALTAYAKPFVQATYALEGDGPCSLEVYHHLLELRHHLALHEPSLSFPGLRPCIEESARLQHESGSFASHVDARLAVEGELRAALKPGFDFMTRVFDEGVGEMKEDVRLYRFLETLNPLEMGRAWGGARSSVADWREELLHLFRGRVSEHEADLMVGEIASLQVQMQSVVLPPLPAGREHHDSEERAVAIWKFWKIQCRESRLPHLRRLVQLAMTITPSSAAAERCFSFLKLAFDRQQLVGEERGALDDYAALSIMEQFKQGNLANKFHIAHYLQRPF